MADTDYSLTQVLSTYRRDGTMIKDKARVLLENWLDRAYGRMCDPDMPSSVLLDYGKILMQLADAGPKANSAPEKPGGGFSISINIPTATGVINITGVTPEDDNPQPMTDMEVIEGIMSDISSNQPPDAGEQAVPEDTHASTQSDPSEGVMQGDAEFGPAPFQVPDFVINSDLVGPVDPRAFLEAD